MVLWCLVLRRKNVTATANQSWIGAMQVDEVSFDRQFGVPINRNQPANQPVNQRDAARAAARGAGQHHDARSTPPTAPAGPRNAVGPGRRLGSAENASCLPSILDSVRVVPLVCATCNPERCTSKTRKQPGTPHRWISRCFEVTGRGGHTHTSQAQR